MPTQAKQPTASSRWKAVAIPSEHGGWGFLLEPILLGLLVAASWAGLLIGLAAFAAFLARTPLKLVMVDRRRGRRYARTTLAERFLALYAGITAVCGGIALLLAGPAILPPLIVAGPLVLVLLYHDSRSASRHWLPELAGPVALGASGASIALAGGWPLTAAVGLWLIVIARAVPSILYVRARLRLEKGQPFAGWPVHLAHAAALIGIVLLAEADQVPALTLIAMLILLVRAVFGLSRYRRPLPAKNIGFQEIAHGLVTVLLAAAGYATGI